MSVNDLDMSKLDMSSESSENPLHKTVVGVVGNTPISGLLDPDSGTVRALSGARRMRQGRRMRRRPRNLLGCPPRLFFFRPYFGWPASVYKRARYASVFCFCFDSLRPTEHLNIASRKNL